MLSKTCPTKVLVRSLNELRLFLFCLAVLGLMACFCSQASAQQYSYGSSVVPTVQPYSHGAISGNSYRAPSYARQVSGPFRSRFGYTEFAHYDTPRGVHRRIPGETFPVQTVVVNFAPPGSYSSPRQTSFRKNAFGRSVSSRW